MNGTNTELGKRLGEPSNRQNGIQARRGPASDDPKRLASIIEENRTNINKGWEILNSLDQLLASLDAKLEARARGVQAVASPVANSEDQAPTLTNAA